MRYFKLINIFLFLLIFSGTVYGAQIVYPKNENVTINSPVTFFVGNEKPDKELIINNEKVKIHPSGGFYHVVKLKPGENIFNIDNKTDDVKVFKIRRPVQTAGKESTTTYKNFPESAIYLTKNDNSPLRNAPDDNGTSRLQNLPKDVPLKVIGYYGKYYKIELGQDDYAWIDKNNIVAANYDYSPAKLKVYTYEEDKSKIVYSVQLNKKVPFVTSEKRVFDLINEKYEPSANGLDITLYNIDGYPENKYEINFAFDRLLFGYKVYFADGNEFRVEIKKVPEANTLYGLVITLDPGHGGSEYGAIGCLGTKEKDVNLAIALKTKAVLEKAGAKVYLTRTGDSDLGLYDRVKFSQKNNSDIFISIHSNALPDSLAETYRSGTSTYYFFPQSAPLARALLTTMTKELGTANDKVRQESFAVIRNSESASVLVEVGYMINPEDNSKLANPEFQQKAALSILHGIERYINELHSSKK